MNEFIINQLRIHGFTYSLKHYVKKICLYLDDFVAFHTVGVSAYLNDK